jgi:hypothetical protein
MIELDRTMIAANKWFGASGTAHYNKKISYSVIQLQESSK